MRRLINKSGEALSTIQNGKKGKIKQAPARRSRDEERLNTMAMEQFAKKLEEKDPIVVGFSDIVPRIYFENPTGLLPATIAIN